jgi:L-ascorbate metabolism protein UlaG (beta-lactamase superfamily)
MSRPETDRITVNTQNSIRIVSDAGTVIYVDPLGISTAPADADLILFTHSHYDHFSPEDVARIKKPETRYIIPSGMKNDLEKIGIGMSSYVRMEAGVRVSVCGIYIDAVPAYNKLKPFHPRRNGWLGYVISVDGIRIYAAGDTDALSENTSIQCDIAMVPIGGTYTMNPKEAAAFINELKPPVVIPTHYGSIVGKAADADEFAKRVDPKIEVVRKLRF